MRRASAVYLYFDIRYLTTQLLSLIILDMVSCSVFLLKNLNFFSKPTRQNSSKYCITPPPPPEFFANKSVSALSLNKKQSSTYKFRHGCRQLRLYEFIYKLAGKQCSWTDIICHALGYFLYAAGICFAYLQKGLLQREHNIPLLLK